MLTSDDIAILKRIFGDASIVRDTIMDVIRGGEDDKMDYQEAYYFLNKCRDKCDEISGEIEKNFKVR